MAAHIAFGMGEAAGYKILSKDKHKLSTKKITRMTKRTASLVALMIMLTVYLSSCSVIGGIFKMGMGFGIFLVLLVIALVFFFLMRMGKGK